jgi:ATP-dependent Clp protease adaptor protein ClpS
MEILKLQKERMTTQTDPAQEEKTDIKEEKARPWKVIVFNNSYNSFDEVADILVRATACSYAQGMALAWRIHTRGKAVVFQGDKVSCERVVSVIRTIKIQVELDNS